MPGEHFLSSFINSSVQLLDFAGTGKICGPFAEKTVRYGK